MRQALLAPLFLLAITFFAYGLLIEVAAHANIESQSVCFASDPITHDLSSSCR
jgi:hypothetical protein